MLSYPVATPVFPLQALNILIGPNGSGKSNLIEAVELLRALPTGLSSATRLGGGAHEWLWKGPGPVPAAILEADLGRPDQSSLRYQIAFAGSSSVTSILDESLEEAPAPGQALNSRRFYYQFQGGFPILHVRDGDKVTARRVQRENMDLGESVFSQFRDRELYPELTWCTEQLKRIQTFREWSFGRSSNLRQPQRADLPNDTLLPDSSNLGLLLNRMEHLDEGVHLNRLLQRVLPRFKRLSTLVQGGTIQLFLHEEGLGNPIPAARMSDGTLRFLAMCVCLLSPNPPPLVCIEEPELGLHPDSIGLLAEMLMEASERMQLIVTTHSDALISALTDDHLESVVVCEHLDGTRLRRLEAEPLEHWLEDYRLGDLWRMGELGGNR